MGAFFANVWTSIREFLASKSRKEKIQMVLFAAVLIVLAVVITVMLNQVDYASLYSGLSPEDAGVINTALTNMSVPHKTEGSFSMTIFVPKNRVSELRAALAADGTYSPGSGFDYSMFEDAMGFGTTDTDQQRVAVMMRQENLRTQILQLDKVTECTVLLSIPQTSAFAMTSDRQQPSASVVISTRNNEALTYAEAKTIFDIVVAGVGGTISYDRISVTDSKANPYYVSEDYVSGNEDSEVRERLALENQARRAYEDQIIALLTPIYGNGHVKCAVNLKLDFDDERSEEIVFAPPVEGEIQGMILSMSELYERSRDGTIAEGIPGTDSNGMGTVEYPYGELEEGEIYEKIMREVNYEMDRTTTQITRAKGSIESLSIGVMLDATSVSEDYSAEVRRVIANALGIKEALVTVESLPFQVINDSITQALTSQQEFENMLKSRELLRTAIICLTVLLLGAALLLLIRSLLKKKEPEPVLVLAGAGEALPDGDETGDEDGETSAGLLDVMVGGDGDVSDGFIEYEKPQEPQPPQHDFLSDIKRMIDSDPNNVAQLLRNWLIDE